MNALEKSLPRPIREKMASLIVTALGLFLALQYNEVIQSIILQFFPMNSNSPVGRIIYIIVLTIVIVYASTLVEKALDGR